MPYIIKIFIYDTERYDAFGLLTTFLKKTRKLF